MNAPDGTHHVVLQGEQRFRVIDFFREQPFFVARVLRVEEPTTQSPEIEARFLHLRNQALEALQLLPQVPQELIGAVQAASSPAALTNLVSAYLDVLARPEAGDPGDDRPPRPHGEGVALARPTPRGAAADERDRPADQGRLRRAPARGDPARADGRHPAPARGRRRQGTGGRGTLGGDRQGEHAQGGGGPGAQGTQALRADAGGGGRGRHGPHLPRLAGRPALGLARGEADRPRRGAPHPRRGPFRAGEDQAADRRVPGGPQARAGGQGADPLLRRPAGRRQDLARPVDRPRHGPAVHPRQPGRRPRRGGDPRPPAHLYRRAARQHHPGHPPAWARATAS